ncbi:hypothetical protein TNCV_3870461 [Trichonephila clavipes]|nr:hypothetical protein TNCV_3870461 [Trichonephila clavipes]
MGNESVISIPNFNCIVKNKRPNTRAGGVAIYQNSCDAFNIITPSMECSFSQSDIYVTIQSSVGICAWLNTFVEWAQKEIAVVPDFHKRILFSVEAHFWLNGYVNKQNCRIWSEANPQVYVETPLHPEKLTVWCALWAGGILLQKR